MHKLVYTSLMSKNTPRQHKQYREFHNELALSRARRRGTAAYKAGQQHMIIFDKEIGTAGCVL